MPDDDNSRPGANSRSGENSRPGGNIRSGWSRVRRVLLRSWSAQRRRNRSRTTVGKLLTAGICVLAGLMVMVSALNARGTDLRPGRNTDLVSLVQSQSQRNAQLTRELTEVRQEVDTLTAQQQQTSDLAPQLGEQAAYAGLTAVSGPAVTVVLDDAPDSVAADGIDEDLLVVHQQDIQSVVNTLWRGGAEAMTIQGQRVVSTTGIKCVGNTVVLHGIPYAPPYVISAIGDQRTLQDALAGSESIRIFQQYVQAYGLVYEQSTQARADFGAHEGTLDLRYAQPR